jgi:hypothetical protein
MTTAQFQWLDTYQSEIAAVGSVSLVLLLITLLATPWLISLLPVDYFRETKRPSQTSGVLAITLATLRNILGALFMVVGIIMLLLPGPGLVCFIMGLSLCEFPGKQSFLRNLITRFPSILNSLNWFRRKSGKERLLPPED